MKSRLGLLAFIFCVGLARADEPTSVQLLVGETLNVCQAQLAVCPLGLFSCDDPKIAIVLNGKDGGMLQGISPGTTLCAVAGPGGAFRRVLKVTVTPP